MSTSRLGNVFGIVGALERARKGPSARPWTSEQRRLRRCAWNGNVPDAVYDEVSSHFTEQELVALTLVVVAINSWNRFNVAFRVEAGHYQPGMLKHLQKTA